MSQKSPLTLALLASIATIGLVSCFNEIVLMAPTTDGGADDTGAGPAPGDASGSDVIATDTTTDDTPTDDTPTIDTPTDDTPTDDTPTTDSDPGIDVTPADVPDDCDFDGDGAASRDCDGHDCDDHDGDRYPGNTDRVGDGIDQNCDGIDGVDADGDGVASRGSGGSDCNDRNRDIRPGAEELCDGEDSDCDGDDAYDGVCGPDSRCLAGRCIGGDRRCSTAGECGPGERCVAGVCVPHDDGTCEFDGNCGDGEYCDDGVCVSVGVSDNCTERDLEIIESSDVVESAQTCGLGCLGDDDPGTCSAECIVDSTGLSYPCASCYGAMVSCTIDHCLVPCASDPSSDEYLECQVASCMGAFEECSGIGFMP